MAGYRRFIAYVYEYRKGKKENNCGFIKVEVRERRCTLEIHLQCPGLSPQMECRIYGFVRNGGLIDGNLLDTCITDEGAAECLIETDALNMSNTGIGISKMGGLILKTDSGAFFGTEWDDISIRPENFREVRVNTKSGPERTETGTEKNEPESGKKTPAVGERSSEENRMDSVNERIHMLEERTDDAETSTQSERKNSAVTEMSMCAETKSALDTQINIQPEKKVTTAAEMNIQETGKTSITEIDMQQPENPTMETGSSLQKLEGNEAVMEGNTAVMEGNTAGMESNAAIMEGDTVGMERNKADRKAEVRESEGEIPVSETDARQDEQRQSKNNPHPEEDGRIFEDGEFMECRRIQLKDLSHLNRRDAAMRNNRFLQYGYYNFGHLLLCRRHDGRYILGVPGGYDQQERFMAGMFGFPYFKESHRIQLPKGRGGYWYRLINTPDFH